MPHPTRLLFLLLLATLTFVIGGCAFFKPAARTVNDVARIACETTFGEEELPQGMSLEDFCKAHENLQPFIDQILAAKAGVKAGLTPPPPE